MSIEKKLSGFYWKAPFLSKFRTFSEFPVSDVPTIDIKVRSPVVNNLFPVLVWTKCTVFYYTRFIFQQLIRQKFLKDELSESNRRFSRNWQEPWKKTMKVLERVFAKQDKVPLLWLLPSKTNLPTSTLSYWLVF